MPKTTFHTFVISTLMAKQNLLGFLDMLRYDQAKVLEADTSLIVLSTEHPPTDGRWASFRIYVLAQTSGNYPDIRALKAEAAPKTPIEWPAR